MSRFKRSDVLATMKRIGVIPVFYHPDVELVKNVVRACAAGGATAIEFTNRGDRALDVFLDLADWAVDELPEVMLGVGSVIDAPTAAMYIAAGADFIVSPILDAPTAELCNARKIAFSPGCATPTEVNNAHKLGVDIVKLFPGGAAGGPAMVSAIRAPMPWAEIMPTGGVAPTEESLREWFGAGIVCAGMGSKLISKALLASEDWDALTATVRATVELIAQIRSE